MTLFLALIVLVAMLLSGIALFRTVDSGVLVAGNIAMQKSATRQGDQGTEAAIEWLTSAGTALYTTAGGAGHGYVANALNDAPGTNQTWAQWWDIYTQTHAPASLPEDPNTGNKVYYLIQRLCSGEGQPYTGGLTCVGPPPSAESNTGGSKAVSVVALQRANKVYYRITSKIVGPRNTVSFVQTVVAM
ncbi:MAG: hypothetical protein N3C63_10395 [Rhodocyclaceae bacterium]|nr:hypothetical protein [Rhodocyclaceae bacterium]